jgi:hypothetical protein
VAAEIHVDASGSPFLVCGCCNILQIKLKETDGQNSMEIWNFLVKVKGKLTDTEITINILC